MRPIATLAPAPLRFLDAPRRFSDAVVASPGQRPVQRLPPGYDLTVGRAVRGRFMARLRRPPRGQRRSIRALTPRKVGIAGARRVKRAMMMGHRGVSLPGALMIARWRIFEFRQRPCGASCGRLRGKPGRPDAGAPTREPSPVRAAQFANLDKDPMERHAVGLAARRRTRGGSEGPVPMRGRNSRISTKTLWSAMRSAWRQAGAPGVAARALSPGEGAIRESRQRPYGASCGRLGGRPMHQGWQPGPVPGRAAQFANLDNDPMERHAVGFAAGRGARGGSRGPVPRRAAQFANLDKDPMERRAVGLAAGRDAGAPTWELSPVRVAQLVQLDNDPMEPCAVGLAASRDPGDAKHGCPHPASGAIRESRQGPYGTPHSGLGQRTGARGCRSGTWTRARGAIRESRQRPGGTPRGRLGRTGPQGCQPGARPPGAPTGRPTGRVAQFANLGSDLC
jgi:hypothetical protein